MSQDLEARYSVPDRLKSVKRGGGIKSLSSNGSEPSDDTGSVSIISDMAELNGLENMMSIDITERRQFTWIGSHPHPEYTYGEPSVPGSQRQGDIVRDGDRFRVSPNGLLPSLMVGMTMASGNSSADLEKSISGLNQLLGSKCPVMMSESLALKGIHTITVASVNKAHANMSSSGYMTDHPTFKSLFSLDGMEVNLSQGSRLTIRLEVVGECASTPIESSCELCSDPSTCSSSDLWRLEFMMSDHDATVFPEYSNGINVSQGPWFTSPRTYLEVSTLTGVTGSPMRLPSLLDLIPHDLTSSRLSELVKEYKSIPEDRRQAYADCKPMRKDVLDMWLIFEELIPSLKSSEEDVSDGYGMGGIPLADNIRSYPEDTNDSCSWPYSRVQYTNASAIAFPSAESWRESLESLRAGRLDSGIEVNDLFKFALHCELIKAIPTVHLQIWSIIHSSSSREAKKILVEDNPGLIPLNGGLDHLKMNYPLFAFKVTLD
jgi:hypothetical protein